MKSLVICNGCTDRPEGCWKNVPCGCEHERKRLFAAATACPIGKWDRLSIDLRQVDGLIYTSPHKRVLLTDTFKFQVYVGKKFSGDWRMQVAHDYGRLLAPRKPPFLLLEDDCIAKRALGVVDFPADADVLMLGGGKRGAGRAHLKVGAKRAHGYSYEDMDEDWMRVWGMLYTHAMLFLSQRAIDLTADHLSRANRPGDQITAALQSQLIVYCLKKPLLTQRNNDQTWNYAPSPRSNGSWPPESAKDRIRRLRRERKEVLAWRKN